MIHTYASGQSTYNLIKCNIASLSIKLAGITLPVGEFKSHLNSQGKVVDEELAWQNFEYLGKNYVTYGKEMTYIKNLWK